MDDFQYTELLPLGHDETPYRLITMEGVSTFDTPEGTFLKVELAAIRRLTAEAMHDIAHFLRPGHLRQLANTQLQRRYFPAFADRLPLVAPTAVALAMRPQLFISSNVVPMSEK